MKVRVYKRLPVWMAAAGVAISSRGVPLEWDCGTEALHPQSSQGVLKGSAL